MWWAWAALGAVFGFFVGARAGRADGYAVGWRDHERRQLAGNHLRYYPPEEDFHP